MKTPVRLRALALALCLQVPVTFVSVPAFSQLASEDALEAQSGAEATPEPVVAVQQVRIVLLPMVVHSAENPEYVRAGLADMVSSRLERIPDFVVVRIEDSDQATTNLAKALKTARAAGGDFVLFGSFTRFGTGASLDVECAAVGQRANEAPLREIFVHSGSIGDVIPDLDDLVGKVARFVLRDYEQRAAEAGEPVELPTRALLREMQHRLTALEEQSRQLRELLAHPPLPPLPARADDGDVSGL